MPRMPKPLECDCHVPVNASEDVKLKIMEAKLREELKEEFVLKEKLKTLNGENLNITDTTITNIKINGIKKIESTKVDKKTTYTITYTDDTTYVFEVLDGETGSQGEQGPKGDTGEKGADGLTTKIKVNDVVYTQTEGQIDLPDYPDISTKAEKSYVDTEVAKKQNILSAGENITINGNIISAAQYDDTIIQNRINSVEVKIPTQATAENQLADKDFVNSSIQAMAADYLTANSTGDSFASRAALITGPWYHAGTTVTPKNNDYAIVAADEAHENKQCRYLYQDGWNYQYSINTTFTAAQQAAINSGVTEDRVTQIQTNEENINYLNLLVGSKQDKLTAGANITIENNVISSVGGGSLKNEFTTTLTVGGVPAGTTFAAGTLLEDIIKQMLQKALLSLVITTPPTKVTYTAGESFETAGMVVTARYSTGDEVVTDYTYSPTGALTTADTKITISYGGKSVEQPITVNEPIATLDIYYGASDLIPTGLTGLTKKIVNKSDLLADDGYEQLIVCGNVEEETGQYPVFAVPTGYKVTSWYSSGYGVPYTGVTAENYIIYYITNQAYDEPDGTNYTLVVREN